MTHANERSEGFGWSRRAAVVGGATLLLVATGVGVSASSGRATTQVPTTLLDFFGPGTQPETLTDEMRGADRCDSCHGGYDEAAEPYTRWAASLMGQAMRDPLFKACMTIAEQDAAFSGDLCLRCHTPGGWAEGRSEPTDGSALIDKDFQGVTCHSCHRMVDPVYTAGQSPVEDQAILAALGQVPVDPHSGQFVLDPEDRRRGPFDLGNFNKHDWFMSPFHRSSVLCATCHDVSNPAFTDAGGGVYVLNDLDAPHPTHDKYDEFPVERTYSEWAQSSFAVAPIDMGGRFGGDNPLVSSCQDCHQPDTFGKGCKTGDERADLPQHDFNGGNTWILRGIRELYDDADSLLTEASAEASIARALSLLELASDMELFDESGQLRVRITNETGHKLPSGYPEGRRMWLNVRFLDDQAQPVAEHGAYDFTTAALTTSDTKVYEAKLGVDAAVSAATGIPEGPGFHFAVANKWFKDNRIPPRGFTNAGFAAVQAAPVAYAYADGEYWDDTVYEIPTGAVSAEVTLYYQTASREYIEFLRDENTTNTDGDVLYALWADPLIGDKSRPAVMDQGSIAVTPVPDECAGDVNGDGGTDVFDFSELAANFGAGPGATRAMGDLTGDGFVDVFDFAVLAADFGCASPGS